MADPRTIAEAIRDEELSSTEEDLTLDFVVLEAVEWLLGAGR